MGKDDVWSGKQFEEWDEFVDEVVQVGGRQELRIAKRNLERQDGDWVDPMFFAEDYTVLRKTCAAQTACNRVSVHNVQYSRCHRGALADHLRHVCARASHAAFHPHQVAAATGFQVWEGARAVVKLIGDDDAPLAPHIKGKRVLELGSGTGLAGLCASVIGGDVIVSGRQIMWLAVRPSLEAK